ncbi:MAG TPA: hypothetical protein VF984_10490 [Actinomycetota bacterium]
MKRIVAVTITSLVAVTLLGAVPAAASGGDARSTDVIRTGSCSGSSAWKLKLSPDHGKIEADFEVHQAQANQTWRVRMRHNGNLFFHAARKTDAGGSFDVTRRVANRSGKDSFLVKATNASTGEVCRATGSF